VFNAFLFLASFALYLAAVCPAVSVPDTAELFLTGINLDVGHPPGYALEALLIRLALLIPVGGPFMRASLVSALAGAGTTVLIGSTARALGARPAAAAVGALLFTVSPFAWWQATMVEKYSLQLMLAALVVRTSLPYRARPIPAAFALGLAMLHHPLAMFLAPLVLIPLLRHSSRRTVAFAAFTIILAASLRPVYAAIRSNALEGSPTAINWGEPSRAGTLTDYLRLKYFSGMFSGTEAGVTDHLRHYPAELSWPGLVAGFFGLVLLGLARPWTGTALAATAALTVTFAFHYSLPLYAVGASHQNVFLLLALGAALALEWLILRRPRWRTALVVVAAFAIGALGTVRFPLLNGSRHLFHHDYATAFLRLAPPGAVCLEGTPYDAFLCRTMEASADLRADLGALGMPGRTASGSIFIRRRYRAWADAVLPGRKFAFTDFSPTAFILTNLLARSGTCIVTPSLDLAAPLRFFERNGPMLVAKNKCPARVSANPWRGLSTRTWFLPGSDISPNRTVLDVVANGLLFTAYDLVSRNDLPEAGRLLRECTRLSPCEPVFHVGLANVLHSMGKNAEAVEALRNAIAADPDAPDGWCYLLEMQVNSGAQADAARLIRKALSRSSFSSLPSAGRALEALGRKGIVPAYPLARRVFAEAAVAQALALRNNLETASRREGLLRNASSWAPGWREPARLLEERGR